MAKLSPWVQSIGSFVEPVVAPTTDPDTGPFVSLLIAKDWLPFVLGALTQLQLSSTWVGDDVAKQLAVDRATLLMNSIAGPSAAAPGIPDSPIPLVRFYATTGNVQTSFDGGVTWDDSPGSDPRNSVTYPPPTGSNIQCDAAASVVRRIQDVLAEAANAVNLGTGAGGIGLGIVTALADLGPYGLLIDLFVLFGLSLIAAGFGAITGALTSTVYDTFECILYCNVSSNGRWTQAQFNAVVADVGDQITGLAGTLLQGILALMGFGGLCQAAALKLDTDTCGGCGCTWCFEYDFTVEPYEFSDVPGANHQGWSAGVGFQAVGGETGSLANLGIHRVFLAAFNISSLVLTYTKTAGGGGNNVNNFSVNLAGVQQAVNTSNSLGTNITKTLTYSGPVDEVRINLNSGTSAATVRITKLRIHGTGDNPFGSSNC